MSGNEIIGNLLGMTTPTEVTVCVDPTIVRSNPLRIGEHLIIEYECQGLSEPVLATVFAIGLENLNLPTPILTSPEEFRSISMIGDLSDGEVLTAKARILGYLNKANELEIPRFSPPPAAKVYRAPVNLLQKVFGEGDIRLGGLLTNPDVEVKLNVNEVVRRHLAVLSITGGGKGNTVAVIVSNILNMGGSVVIVDPHSEYVSMRRELKDKLVAFSFKADSSKGIRKLRFRYNSFTASDFISIIRIPSNATHQRALFRRAFHLLEGREWDDEDLREALRQADGEESDSVSEQYSALIDRMSGTTEFQILDKTEEVPLTGTDTPGIVNEGKVTVLSLAGLDNDIQQAVVRRIASKMYKGAVAWRKGEKRTEKLPGPVFLVIEESHNFIPNDDTTVSKAIIRRIASEGRKWGIGLCVVSQRPGKIDSNVLSQCNSMIVLRVVNPRDQGNIRDSAEALSQELMEELPGLNVGEAVVFGPAVNIPALVKVDKYLGTLGGEDVNVVNAWSKAGQKKKKRARRHDGDDAF
jgi:DNA helicase HerA-like ATPase